MTGPGIVHDENARIRWVARADGRERPLPVDVVSLRTGTEWAGLRLEETRSRPGELPEGLVPSHVVVVNLERSIRTETFWVGERQRSEVTVPPNGVTVFPSGLPYVTRWRDPIANVALEIAPDFIASVIGHGGSAPELKPQLASDDPFVAHLVLALREHARIGHAADPLQAEALGTVLAAHLVRRYGDLDRPFVEPRGALSARQFDRVVAFICDRLAEPLTLHELAAAAGMSVYRFARMFKARSGVSPHHYVLGRRLDRAKALLHRTNLPVGEIAIQCGFSHPSHFTSTFQRTFAITPSEYRRAKFTDGVTRPPGSPRLPARNSKPRART